MITFRLGLILTVLRSEAIRYDGARVCKMACFGEQEMGGGRLTRFLRNSFSLLIFDVVLCTCAVLLASLIVQQKIDRSLPPAIFLNVKLYTALVCKPL